MKEAGFCWLLEGRPTNWLLLLCDEGPWDPGGAIEFRIELRLTVDIGACSPPEEDRGNPERAGGAMERRPPASDWRGPPGPLLVPIAGRFTALASCGIPVPKPLMVWQHGSVDAVGEVEDSYFAGSFEGAGQVVGVVL